MAWYIHAGLMLGFRERDVWRMTPRKIYALYVAHIQHVETCARIHAWRLVETLAQAMAAGQPPTRGSIDDAIPPDDC